MSRHRRLRNSSVIGPAAAIPAVVIVVIAVYVDLRLGPDRPQTPSQSPDRGQATRGNTYPSPSWFANPEILHVGAPPLPGAPGPYTTPSINAAKY
jgi:hypothetical protein